MFFGLLFADNIKNRIANSKGKVMENKKSDKEIYCGNCGEVAGENQDYRARKRRIKTKPNGIINLLPDWQH